MEKENMEKEKMEKVKTKSPTLESITVTAVVIEGKELTPKKKTLMSHSKGSDAYVALYCGGKFVGKTRVVKNSCNPFWDHTITFVLDSEQANAITTGSVLGAGMLQFKVFHKKIVGGDAPMGFVAFDLPLTQASTKKWHNIDNTMNKDATGKLEIMVDVTARKALQVIRGNSHELTGNQIRVAAGWELEMGGIDLDISCVSVDSGGQIIMADTVYYGDLFNSNGSVSHSGDAVDGATNIQGSGDDERIDVDLKNTPSNVYAMYFILTVATPGVDLSKIQSARVNVVDTQSNMIICQYSTISAGDVNGTALFLMRLCRVHNDLKRWEFSFIGDTDDSARDFGSLIPEIKSYCRDFNPNIHIDRRERVAVMRKGSVIRLDDYSSIPGRLPSRLALGLAWDITEGVKIDLDVAATLLDEDRRFQDMVFYGQLKSRDGALTHSGDEREGDAVGDDELIFVDLHSLDKSIKYICFTVTSYSRQELDDVAAASCHLFDPLTKKELAVYKMTNDSSLDGHTALIMCYLIRGEDGHWLLDVVAKPSLGKIPIDMLPDMKKHLKGKTHHGPTMVPPSTEVIVNAMPESIPIHIPEDMDIDCDLFVVQAQPEIVAEAIPYAYEGNDIPTVTVV